ncbi:hypothetical protein RJ641_015108, partial [Dillenia turbinata]
MLVILHFEQHVKDGRNEQISTPHGNVGTSDRSMETKVMTGYGTISACGKDDMQILSAWGFPNWASCLYVGTSLGGESALPPPPTLLKITISRLCDKTSKLSSKSENVTPAFRPCNLGKLVELKMLQHGSRLLGLGNQ